MLDGIRVAAPCKINLHLRVLDRRDDSFHDLESVFQALSIGDELRFASLKERSICELRMAGSVPLEQNSVFKAVALFRAVTGFDGGLRVDVRKRIPLGSGLGGGSSDAAAALLALDALARTRLDRAVLLRMAAELGSDVPFFLRAGTAFVQGRGERVRDLPTPPGLRVVLVNPGLHSDTREAFRLLDAARAQHAVPAVEPLGEAAVVAGLAKNAAEWPFGNDFLPVLLRFAPPRAAEAYRRILTGLSAAGADFVSLTGSGSTCFGVFHDQETAQKAVLKLSGDWDYVHLTFPLARAADRVVQ